ncbi:hypothetical protein KY331_05290 [Candidatus Woesearchaeota archaeon]|nr:hypothetical protein [Candidatus Woesearchaeota archaeon]
MTFQKYKKDFLKKLDKSKKGAIDKEILALINLINKNPYYYTTSSCSGRIVLLEKKSEKKQEAKWLLITHKKTSFKEINSKLKNLPKYPVWFRFEPMILHLAADSIQNAQKIINTARNIGFKRSGIQSTRKKIIIEIASTEILNTIIADKSKLLVNDDHLKILIKEANKKLKRTQRKIKELYKEIKKI